MKLLLFIFSIFFLLQEIPLKPKEEFEIKLDYQFRDPPAKSTSTIYVAETVAENQRRTSHTRLPYLILNINLLKLSDEEVRARVTNNFSQSGPAKKISKGKVIPIDVGFTDDVKDRVTPHEYRVTFLSDDKKELSQIIILIEEDGTFLVNGDKRGKF